MKNVKVNARSLKSKSEHLPRLREILVLGRLTQCAHQRLLRHPLPANPQHFHSSMCTVRNCRLASSARSSSPTSCARRSTPSRASTTATAAAGNRPGGLEELRPGNGQWAAEEMEKGGPKNSPVAQAAEKVARRSRLS